MFKFTPTDEWYNAAAAALEEGGDFIGAGGDPMDYISDETVSKEVCDCCNRELESCNCDIPKFHKVARATALLDAIEIVRKMNSIDDAVSALEDLLHNA